MRFLSLSSFYQKYHSKKKKKKKETKKKTPANGQVGKKAQRRGREGKDHKTKAASTEKRPHTTDNSSDVR
jgi:hypothetical protein